VATAAAGLAVVAVAAIALLAGHDGDGPHVRPSTTDGPQHPTRPADLERSDERGAVAAAVYVLELEPYGLRSGDWREFVRLCSTQSGWCRDKAESMRGVAAGTVRYDGCEASPQAVQTTPTDAPDTFVVTIAQRQAACVRHDRAASDVYGGNDAPDALPDLLDLTVRHGTAGWQVVRASLA